MSVPILIWVVLGLVLLAAEMMTLTFVLVFFGVGALVVAILKWLLGLESIPFEILIFSGISVGGLLCFRRKFRESWSHKEGAAIDVGKVIILNRDVPACGRAQVEYQGTTWTAENESDVLLSKGSRAVIVRVDGLTLIVKGV
ncbi:MAG: hypothetical protein COV45_01645 [Deltaproteobacteria bacterium CG11_big_fil_rev_8_21_14_0_20_47_16]|nr:MAG: hypothetical protein COV45_01645 [Deltaproteobacteria bacterium CG11_big_fil_rev_8_21_14_0_20_47_16]